MGLTPALNKRRRRRSSRRRFDHGEPISRIDTRPMMFVVMFVASMLLFPAGQVRPHVVTVDMWDGRMDEFFLGPYDPNLADADLDSIYVNRVTLDEYDRISWNGQFIHQWQLLTLLHEVQTINPQPMVELEPAANASYDLSAKTLALLIQSGATFRIAGTNKYCRFDAGDRTWGYSDRGGGNRPCDPRYIIHNARPLQKLPLPPLP